LLAALSIAAGVISIEPLYNRQFALGEGTHSLSFVQQLIYPFVHSPAAAIGGLIAAALGIFGAYKLYAGVEIDPLPARLGALSRAMRNRFYFDELYAATVIRFHEILSKISDWIERWLIAGLVVRGTHGSTEILGRALRLMQTGNLQTYAFLFALGVALVLYLALK